MKRNRPHSRITLALTSVGIMVAALLSGCTSDSPASPDSSGSADSSVSAGNSDTSALVVDTPDGAVQGVVVGEAEAFYGLPFAKPPVYDAMWAAPTDPEPWRELATLESKRPPVSSSNQRA